MMYIQIEDWLRDCVYHNGRSGYVTLPTYKVLEAADFIERLRADRKTEPEKSCSTCGYSPQTQSCDTCEGYSNWWSLEDEQQTDNDFTLTYTCCFSDCENFKHFGFSEKCIKCKRKTEKAEREGE